MYKLIIKPVFFLFSPERIHHIAFSLIKFFSYFPFIKLFYKLLFATVSKEGSYSEFDLLFKNRVGLAAGFDKDALLYNELADFGFGFLEIGTVTPLAQTGNPRPRLFRLPKDAGLINRMGFNNSGVEAVVSRLKNKKTNLIIGGNIGKNKVTPNKDAIKDYEICFESLFNYVDYFVVNVSSPNTPDLRALQEKEPLMELLSHLQQINAEKEKRKPILLKISPDLSDHQLDDIIEIVQHTKLDGIIATNTTIERSNLIEKSKADTIGAGGLSGAPLKERATQVIKYISDKTNGTLPIIGVGGIHSGEDAVEKIKAGASLVQIYTGFIYEGPGLVKEINKSIRKHENN